MPIHCRELESKEIKMKILLCSSEVVPFAKTGGLADVAGSLPKALAALGHDVRVVLPKYGSIDEKKFALKKVCNNVAVSLGAGKENAVIWQSDAMTRVKTYLIENNRLFSSGPLYGQANDPERFIFYQRATLEMLSALDWIPEVIHCNDWQTGLLPLYLQMQKRDNGPLAKTASIYTVHNLAYQGCFGKEVLALAGLPEALFTPIALEFYGNANLMKAGLLYTDIISTVSPTYAKEIQTAEYGERLEGVLAARKERLRGILNGLDYEVWNPGEDKFIKSTYNAADPKGKASCKRALQTRLKLAKSNAPMLALVTRLAAQKGLDILEEIFPELLSLGVQLVILGLGDKHYQDLLVNAAQEHPQQVSINLEFNEELAHQIYAGADMFLMPSRYEPCGLGQLIALRYGTVPVVRATGGLADTVFEAADGAEVQNGFRFEDYRAVGLLATLARALLAYRDKPTWKGLVTRGMECDFSWSASARKYEAVYQEAVKLHHT
jgi:starch synthase